MGVLAEFVRGHFGVNTRYNPHPLTNTIGIAGTKLWNGNPDRLGLVFINHGVSDAFLSTEPSIAVSTGFRLAANGGHVVMKAEEDGELVGYQFFGIAGAATGIFSAEIEGR